MYNLNEGLLVYLFGGGEAVNITAFYITYAAFILISIVSAYLLGSINSAIITSKLLYHDDIRKHGSGNPGLTNMFRTYGKCGAGLTLLGDVLKNALAILIAGILFGFNYVGGISNHDGYCYMAGLFAIVGHMFPVYYGFKGGKGVLSTATVTLILAPIPFAILFTVFIVIVACSKYVSLGSVSAAILLPVVVTSYFKIALLAQAPGIISLSTIIIAILIVWCHRGNLQRISDRTERKISFKKKKTDESEE
jgi:glycerol-3-phosphate acyltransferase PlsY